MLLTITLVQDNAFTVGCNHCDYSGEITDPESVHGREQGRYHHLWAPSSLPGACTKPPLISFWLLDRGCVDGL